jgi:hypothetical protein
MIFISVKRLSLEMQEGAYDERHFISRAGGIGCIERVFVE